MENVTNNITFSTRLKIPSYVRVLLNHKRYTEQRKSVEKCPESNVYSRINSFNTFNSINLQLLRINIKDQCYKQYEFNDFLIQPTCLLY